ncbi:MAG TPA: phospholipase D-like domain-containing protein, partial [Longimicrobiaceae bacterium]|nr:phospholipase D-like domain-containing protein [Longimicrobiaceae bacterium]
ERKEPKCKHLLVAPFALRRGMSDHIEAEIRSAQAGGPSGILLKMNSLEDRKIIRRLYEASQAGVPVQLIIRGICCLVPGVPELSESIAARSIVDRFLEHARVFVFHQGGEEVCYLASADWMARNLSHRVEVAFPLYDLEVRREVREMLDLQLADTAKARVIDAGQRNLYAGDPPHSGLRSQIETYRMLQARCSVGEQRERALAST